RGEARGVGRQADRAHLAARVEDQDCVRLLRQLERTVAIGNKQQFVRVVVHRGAMGNMVDRQFSLLFLRKNKADTSAKMAAQWKNQQTQIGYRGGLDPGARHRPGVVRRRKRLAIVLLGKYYYKVGRGKPTRDVSPVHYGA